MEVRGCDIKGQTVHSKQLQGNRQIFSPGSGEFKVETSGITCPRASNSDIRALAPSFSPVSLSLDSPPGAMKAAGTLRFAFKSSLFQKISLDQVESCAHP